MKHSKSLVTKILVPVTYLGMIVMNWLANALPINGVTAGGVSDSYPNLFAPAGIAFSIWGLIYLMLGAYTLWQTGLFQQDKGSHRNELYHTVGIYFTVSSVANALWIMAWHHFNMGLALLLITVMLVCLILIASRLSQEEFTLKEKAFIAVPFSVYFGWITVATIANVTILLVSIGWDGFGLAEATWTVIILITGLIIGIARMLKDSSAAYGLVFIWAYTGILIKHTSAAYLDGQYPAVITTLISCIVILIIAEGYLLLVKGKKSSSVTA